MPTKDPRVDRYIAEAADFAQPMLKRLRKLVHAACPDVTETIKWSTPFYEHQGILLATPAFKRHFALIFWQGKTLFKDLPAKDNPRTKFRRLTSNAELPDDRTLTRYIRAAVALNEAGVKPPPRPRAKAKPAIPVPDYFLTALKANPAALAAFEQFSPSCKREYLEWITDAKCEETRTKRLQSALAWIAKGKSRNWKYE